MAVAKSYTNYPIIEGPYTKNGKEYVIIATKTNPRKEVRWYSEQEYCKMYGLEYTVKCNEKHMFGFHKGYIHIFTNDGDETNVFFRKSCARYSTFFGWYVVSNDEVPDNLPYGIRAIKLMWEDVSENDKLMSHDRVKTLCDYFRMEA